MTRYDWTPASKPPDSSRRVVVWQAHEEWDLALYRRGAWISHTGLLDDVTHWRDVAPPSLPSSAPPPRPIPSARDPET